MLKSVTNEDTIEKIVNILEQEESVELKQNCLTFLKVLLDQSSNSQCHKQLVLYMVFVL